MTTLTKAPNTSITMTEAELAEHETTIREGAQAYQRVGFALLAIRDGKGYHLRGYKTFEQYCAAAFGITDRHGRRLIAATEASQKIEKAVGQAPATEGVARELVKVADDPIVLQKVQERLEKKKTGIATAPAELVKDVVAAVTGKPRPTRTDAPRPAANGKPAAAAAAPAIGADDATTLQAVLTSARSYLSNHPWLADDDAAHRLVKQLDQALIVAGNLLKAAYGAARPAGQPAGKGAEPSGPPRCPECKQPVKPGAPWCDNCGAAL